MYYVIFCSKPRKRVRRYASADQDYHIPRVLTRRTAKKFKPTTSPLFAPGTGKELWGEKVPTAMMAAGIPMTLVLRRAPWRKLLTGAGEAAGLAGLGAGGAFLGLRAFQGSKRQAEQVLAASNSPLKAGDYVERGDRGEPGVWRGQGKRQVFVPIKWRG